MESGITQILKRIGFQHNCIYDVVLTTYCENGAPTSSIVGIVFSPKRIGDFIIRISKSLKSCQNMLLYRCGVVNIVNDPEVLFKCLISNIKEDSGLPQEWFEKATIIKAPRLTKADTHIEFNIMETKEEGDKVIFVCRTMNVTFREVIPTPYTRAYMALVDSIILANKFNFLIDKKDEEKAKEIIDRIRGHDKLIKTLAPNSSYHKMMITLRTILESNITT